ncbi:hypothetical protein [Chryseobacterium echinoideorum]|uniref:hypothetical protein n=1 Tax=Chryseobacterium echinoideorum TaxID=1549648 RepID=UPI0016280D11|nr:hypothetical protein [Chryseobacterium echinoideorum]
MKKTFILLAFLGSMTLFSQEVIQNQEKESTEKYSLRKPCGQGRISGWIECFSKKIY